MVCNDDGTLTLRCDTLDNWSNVNPILEYGELVIVTENDSVKLKAGNGKTRFNDLPYCHM